MATDKSPAFQFYPTDFLSSSKVARMSLTEIGIYTILLCHCWLDGGLPKSVEQLALLVRVRTDRFAKIWAGVLSECFREEGGKLLNIRLERERNKQAHRRSNGTLGGRPKNNLEGVFPITSEEDGDENVRTLVLLKEKKRTSDFDNFWAAYPRRDGKQSARVEWDRLQPTDDIQRAIAADLEQRRMSPQWVKDAGQFIPHARTYLHQRRWEDGFVAVPAVSEKTARTLTSAEQFVRGGQ